MASRALSGVDIFYGCQRRDYWAEKAELKPKLVMQHFEDSDRFPLSQAEDEFVIERFSRLYTRQTMHIVQALEFGVETTNNPNSRFHTFGGWNWTKPTEPIDPTRCILYIKTLYHHSYLVDLHVEMVQLYLRSNIGLEIK